MTNKDPSPNRLINLADWAESKFEKVPHINTLRKWARDGHIKPVPDLVGRSYLVEPSARYSPKVKP